jgi:hypothetical protein
VLAGARILILTMLVAALPASASAEWQFAPFLGQTFKGSTTLWDPLSATDDGHWSFGGWVTLLGDSPFGVEAYYVRTPGFFQRHGSILSLPGSPTITSSRTQAFMGNAVLAMPRAVNRYGLRPFVSGGLGVLHVSHDDPFLPVRVNLLAMNVGGGATGFLTDRVGLRFDLRYSRNVRGVGPDDDLAPVATAGEPVRFRYWTGAIGVVFKY